MAGRRDHPPDRYRRLDRCPLRRHVGLKPPPDAGFSLLEVLVSIAVIGTVMAALTSLLVGATVVTNQQGGRQAAIQLAADGLEAVRALDGPEVAQLPAVAVLPAEDARYHRRRVVTACWQSASTGRCDDVQRGDSVAFSRVTVTVTWRDKACPGSVCTHSTATLVAATASETVLDADETAAPPAIVNPGTLVNQVDTLIVPRQLSAVGTPPLTWINAQLPDGLAMSSAGLITGTPTTVRDYAARVSVRDGFGVEATASFTWRIVDAAPTLGPVEPQSSIVDEFDSVIIPITGGVAPLTWSVTGQPPGLTFEEATRQISGTPTTARTALPVTVTVRSASGESGSVTFTWSVLGVATPDKQKSDVAVPASLQTNPRGGTGSYSCSAQGLPPGLRIDAGTGEIAGTPDTKGNYNVVLAVQDTRTRRIAITTFSWQVK